MTLDRFVLIFCLVVLTLFAIRDARAASSEHLMQERGCKAVAKWSTGVYRDLKENPKILLDGMQADDEIAFAFIRKWIKDGKSSDELYKFTFDSCMGVSI